MMVFVAIYAVRVDRTHKYAAQLMRLAVHQPADISYQASALTSVPQHGRMMSVPLQIDQTTSTDPTKRNLAIVAKLGSDDKVSYHGCTTSVGGLRRAAKGENEKLLKANYTPVYEGQDSVAGRPVDILSIRPNYQGRPQMTLWMDKETHLILRQRKISPDDELCSDMVVKTINYGASKKPASQAASTASHATHGKWPLTSSQLEKETGFRTVRPIFLPAGFKAGRQGVFFCPCKCGMKSQALRYTDGLASFTVFETSDKRFVCKKAEAQKLTNLNSCSTGKIDGDMLAGIKRGHLLVAVIGDLTHSDARKIALSIKP